MLESVVLAALFATSGLYLSKKWHLWQRLRFVPCTYCTAFWLSWGVLLILDPCAWYLTPLLALCSAAGAYYLLLRIFYDFEQE